MASLFDSPDTIQMKGKLTGLTRISRKVKVLITFGIFVVLCVILFSILSMNNDDAAPPDNGGDDDTQKLKMVAPAKPNFDRIGDGQSSVAVAQAQEVANGGANGTAATAPSATQSGQNLGPAYNVGGSPNGTVPQLSSAALANKIGANNGGQVNLQKQNGGGGDQHFLSPEETEAARVKKALDDGKASAVKSGLEMEGGSSNSGLAGLGQSGAGSGDVSAALANIKTALGAAQAAAQGGQAGGVTGYGQVQQDDQNKQGRKEQFMKSNGGAGNKANLMEVVEPPLSAYELQAGWAIPSALECGVNSDLPGQTCARVTENVYDSATGTHLLIPQGSKLIGTYDSQVAYGQQRILAIWNRLNFPDGSSLNLEGMPGEDKSGAAGFDADVNNHYTKVVGGALLMATFSAGISLTQKQNTDANGNGTVSTSQTLSQSLGQQLGQTGSAYIQRGLNVQPTLSRNPGYKFNIIITRNIIFPGVYKPRLLVGR